MEDSESDEEASMTAISKTFSVKNGLDVANTIVLDSNRNLTNINYIEVGSHDLFANINTAANTVRVSQNSGSTLSAKQLNFVNTTNVTIIVSDSGDGNANIEFEVAAGSGGGGAGPSVVDSDVFSANGVQNTFSLTRATSTDKAFVYISGVSQIPEVDYQVSGTTLSFNNAPLNGTTIEVRTISDVSLANVSSFVSDQFVANGVQTVFNLSTTSYSTNGVFVFVDGVTQVPNVDYTVSGNTLTFTLPPESNGVVEIRSVQAVQIPLPSLSNNGTILNLAASEQSFTSGGFTVSTDSISKKYILRGTTSNNAESELFLNGSNTRISVPANTTMFYSVDIVARRTDAADESAGYHLKGVVDNFSDTVADVGSLYELIVAEDDANLIVDARADNTNNTLNIYVTGDTGKTIRWTALVNTVEVAQ